MKQEANEFYAMIDLGLRWLAVIGIIGIGIAAMMLGV